MAQISNKRRKRIINEAKYFVNNNSTVRATAKYFGLSKSTIHRDLTERLPDISLSLSLLAEDVLAKNKKERHIRGGNSTRNKYLELRKTE